MVANGALSTIEPLFPNALEMHPGEFALHHTHTPSLVPSLSLSPADFIRSPTMAELKKMGGPVMISYDPKDSNSDNEDDDQDYEEPAMQSNGRLLKKRKSGANLKQSAKEVTTNDGEVKGEPEIRVRRQIQISLIEEKAKRHITFSKRKAGIMKKAYELATLTGTQVLLLVVSETGWVYTFTTEQFKPMVKEDEHGNLSAGQKLIASCLEVANSTSPTLDTSPNAPPALTHRNSSSSLSDLPQTPGSTSKIRVGRTGAAARRSPTRKPSLLALNLSLSIPPVPPLPSPSIFHMDPHSLNSPAGSRRGSQGSTHLLSPTTPTSIGAIGTRGRSRTCSGLNSSPPLTPSSIMDNVVVGNGGGESQPGYFEQFYQHEQKFSAGPDGREMLSREGQVYSALGGLGYSMDGYVPPSISAYSSMLNSTDQSYYAYPLPQAHPPHHDSHSYQSLGELHGLPQASNYVTFTSHQRYSTAPMTTVTMNEGPYDDPLHFRPDSPVTIGTGIYTGSAY